MSLLDQVTQALAGRTSESERPGLASAITSLLSGGGLGGGGFGGGGLGSAGLTGAIGGLGGLLQRFEASGLGGQVGSWIGTGPNQPVSPDQLGQVLGQQGTDQLARQSGLPAGQLLSMLAQHLPHVVDHLTPGGQIPHELERVSDGQTVFT